MLTGKGIDAINRAIDATLDAQSERYRSMLSAKDVVIEHMASALELAANRLDRLALETAHGSRLRDEVSEWAAEARKAAGPNTELRGRPLADGPA
jgi:hypothetical protein